MNPSHPDSDILDVLKRARLFTQFDDAQLTQLISICTVESYSEGEIIIRQGSRNETIYVILKGIISVFADDEYILQLRRQGDLVGELSLITNRPANATVIANTDVQLFSIEASSIENSNDPKLKAIVYKVFLDILSQKLSLTTKRVIGFQAATQELNIKKQELAKSEVTLSQKDAILQLVLNSMSDGVVVTNAAGELLHTNQAFRKMVGDIEIPNDFKRWPEALGFHYADETTVYRPEDLPMIKIHQEFEAFTEEIFIRNDTVPDGIWLQTSSNLLTIANRTAPQGAVVVFRDFTQKKLEEKALIRARDHAEKTARAKSDFLSVMSHELRTPLNGIIGMTDLMLSGDLDPEQKECATNIKTSGENLLALISNILDYSDLESGNVEPEWVTFDFREHMQAILDAIQDAAQKKEIRLSLSIDPKTPRIIRAYQKGINQVTRQLIDNAIKFTAGGKVELTIRFLDIARPPMLQFAIQDTGIGITEQEFSNLFQPFSQVDSTSTRQFDGTGIGLSVCKKYVALMNGNIWADSQKGVGTTFYFTAEIAPQEDNLDSPNLNPPIGTQQDTSDSDASGKRVLKILVAEDNALNQKLISKILEKLGYQATIANNGREAIELINRLTFDLVLMDLHMPEIDGIEASETIHRQHPDDPPVIIALTATVSDKIKDQCLKAGMSGYLTKPITLAKLAETLQSWSHRDTRR